MNSDRSGFLGAALLAGSVATTGCGGGGGAGAGAFASNQPAEGAYAGSLTRTITVNAPPLIITNDLQLFVLDDGEFWALYGDFSGYVPPYLAGFVTGRGTSSSGSYTASNARDFGITPVVSETLTASYAANVSMAGALSYAAGNIRFSASTIPSTRYNYAAAASLADIQGDWTARTLIWAPATFNISSTGAVVGSTEGCNFAGTLTPRASGKNVFVAAITYGASPCAAPGQTSTGIAVTSLLANGGRQLVVVGVIPAQTYGTVLIGTK